MAQLFVVDHTKAAIYKAGTVEVLTSYGRPVAGYTPADGWFKTAHRWSSTTSRHINKYLDGIEHTIKPQEFLDGLLNQ